MANNPHYTYISIPVKPYVDKYIQKIYGDCIKVSQRDTVSLTLYYILLKNEKKKKYDKVILSYSNSVKVGISDYFCFYRGTRHLSSFSIVQFNTLVEDLFKKDLHRFIDIHRLYGSTIVKAIADFRKDYNLSPEDISDDSMKKSYQRYVEEEEKKRFDKNQKNI